QRPQFLTCWNSTSNSAASRGARDAGCGEVGCAAAAASRTAERAAAPTPPPAARTTREKRVVITASSKWGYSMRRKGRAPNDENSPESIGGRGRPGAGGRIRADGAERGDLHH